jgi:hypothetical protein
MSEPAVIEAAVALIDGLDRAGFEYALSGAVALAYYTTPRATVDLDVAVNADSTRLPELVRVLREAGCDLDEDRALAAAERGDFGARWRGIRIDLFLPVLALSHEAMQRRVRVPFGERQAWILSAEDVALFKLIFGRTKDQADLERLFAAQRGRLDLDYLDRWVAELFAADDVRQRRYGELRVRVAP